MTNDIPNSFRKETMTGPTITERLAHVLYASGAADIPAAVSCDDYSSAPAAVGASPALRQQCSELLPLKDSEHLKVCSLRVGD